jgi:acetyl-CoA carboxylase carboxyltransferase component
MELEIMVKKSILMKAMMGRSYHPRFLFSYPNSKCSVMGEGKKVNHQHFRTISR